MNIYLAGFLQSSTLYANVMHDPRSEYNWHKSERSQGPNLETEIALQKNQSVGSKIACRRLKYFWILWSV